MESLKNNKKSHMDMPFFPLIYNIKIGGNFTKKGAPLAYVTFLHTHTVYLPLNSAS